MGQLVFVRKQKITSVSYTSCAFSLCICTFVKVIFFVFLCCFFFYLEMAGSALSGTTETKYSLYDHRPYPLFEDDYLRVCKIPKRKVGKI